MSLTSVLNEQDKSIDEIDKEKKKQTDAQQISDLEKTEKKDNQLDEEEVHG